MNTEQFPTIRNQNVSTRTGQAEALISRQAQEVLASVMAAKRFPRDELRAEQRILTACSRKKLAEQSQYEYPRGGQKVSGPSIRLAEVIAQNWGNISFGTVELDRGQGKSEMMAFAWDLETNTRQEKIFTVPHVRESNERGSVKIDNSRDIYEITANMGARRVRACILGIIPGDIVDSAVARCNETLRNGNKEPLKDRVVKLIDAFAKEYSVNKEMLEKYIGCVATAWSEMDVIKLGRVYISLRDGMSSREDYFDLKGASKETTIVKSKTQEEFELMNQNSTEDGVPNANPES